MSVKIVMPRLSDSMEEGTITQWLVAEGDEVAEGQPLVEVETDKATVTYEAETAGTVARIAVAAGESARIGETIAVLGEDADEDAEDTVRTAAPVPSAAPAPAATRVATVPAAGTRVKASPLARRLAAGLGVDLTGLTGSGPQGRVIRADVERVAQAAGGAAGPVPGSPTAAPAALGASGNGAGAPEAREPLTRIQQIVARRMVESRTTVPDFELRAEIDMRQAVAVREQLRMVADPPPTYNDFVVRAVALALREFPRVNGSYQDGEIERHGRINIGIAVAGPDTLIVPTIADADKRSLLEIAAAGRELAARARDGRVTLAELEGGTFSVSNLGMFGVDSFSAVINPPQAAILAVGSCRPRPLVDADGTLVAAHTMHVALACDHRIVYGADGARFLARVRELLENPAALLVS